MIQLNSWFNANKLTLNANKSSFTIFKSSNKNIHLPNSIEFLNFKIERTASIKFLGIILDQHLTWDQHINEVCNKLRSLFHVFYSIRRYLAKEHIKTLYYTLIYSRIKYGLAVYGLAGSTKLNRIQFLQNQLLKVLSCKKFRFSTDKLHNEFDLLKVQDMVNQEILTFVHNYLSNSLPSAFNNYYETLASIHGVNTRHGSDLSKKRHRTIPNVKCFRFRYKKSIIPYT